MASIDTRIGRDGKKSYRVRVHKNGKSRTATFIRKTDAKEWASNTEADLNRNYYVPNTKDLKHTVGEAIDRYLIEVLPYKLHNRDQSNPTRHLKWWKIQIGNVRLIDIDDDLITHYRNQLLSGTTHYDKPRSPSTCNRYVISLSHLLNIAQKKWRWLQENPLQSFEKLKEPSGRDRTLSDDERESLLAACKQSVSPDLYTIVILALSTGMRRGEIMSLTWKDVNFKDKSILLRVTKNGDSRVVPLVGFALSIMQERAKVRRLDTKLIFPGIKSDKPVDFRHAWKTALQVANISGFRFHDLRHCFASLLNANNVTQFTIAELLGHKTLAMTMRYTHESKPHMSDAVESMNAKMFK